MFLMIDLGRSNGISLELSPGTPYDEVMSRCTALFGVSLFAAGILTGCTTLARNFDRLRAAMTKPETDEDTHNYGAFFVSLRWPISELPSECSGPDLCQYPQAKKWIRPREHAPESAKSEGPKGDPTGRK
jgi:hypothetical protein